MLKILVLGSLIVWVFFFAFVFYLLGGWMLESPVKSQQSLSRQGWGGSSNGVGRKGGEG